MKHDVALLATMIASETQRIQPESIFWQKSKVYMISQGEKPRLCNKDADSRLCKNAARRVQTFLCYHSARWQKVLVLLFPTVQAQEWLHHLIHFRPWTLSTAQGRDLSQSVLFHSRLEFSTVLALAFAATPSQAVTPERIAKKKGFKAQLIILKYGELSTV